MKIAIKTHLLLSPIVHRTPTIATVLPKEVSGGHEWLNRDPIGERGGSIFMGLSVMTRL